METNFYNRVVATLLAIATVALVLFAVFNLQQEGSYQQPDDGVVWTEAPSKVLTGLMAVRVMEGGPGAQAGIEPGDLLVAVDDRTIEIGADLDRELKHTDVYGKADYSIIRRGIALDPISVIPIPADRTLQDFTRVIGLIYLAIGIYVLFRRWTAPRATHFYIFCLVSFALNTFRYTGKFDLLDWTIYWGNVIAEVLQPALFLHFALVFPEEVPTARLRRLSRWLLPFVYAPAAGIIGLRIAAFVFWQATFALKLRLDQISTAYVAAYFILAAILFLRSYARANTPLLRQQLKWLTRGTMLAVLPFTAFFAVPFLTGLPVPILLQKIAGLSLVILPLTFSWAIVRYRLMDTDLIFKRGVAYTLATGTLVGVYFAVIALISEQIHTRLPEAVREWGLVLTILITAQLFDPLKRRFQSWIDQVFDRHRYDYRKALVDFGRGLSSETDLDALLRSIVDRLPSTLLVAKVAVFLADPPDAQTSEHGFHLAASHGLPFSNEQYTPRLDLGFLDLAFLSQDQPGSQSHIFLENTQQTIHLPAEQQRTAALLDLNYYLPCRVQDASPATAPGAAKTRTIAVIGLGRTIGGDFLSSEDVELLESLASYIGIALQSASLYARLEEQVSEFERLKEFNENIVESINVGILAVDLEDRIESWNAQMEAMYALSRKEAIGQPLTAVFPREFIEAFDRFRNESGVHHLYKFRLTTRAGEARTANIAVAPLLSRDFVAVGRIVLVDDITERVTLEAQLSQADKLSSIGLLAAGVAHEINTPLAVISSYAQMLTKQMRDDARLTPLLERITQQTFRASEIANGLLNFSRTSTTEFRETDLNQVIRDTLALVEHQMKTARITVAMELEGSLPRIHGNPGKLQQVFLNLLLNAKDAMPQGGELRVATIANGHVEAVIADSGAGIAPEHLKRIYDPFFTTKSAPKPGERRGTGLGLSVSYGIIQEHAGKINVESTLGVGTTFHLEFPLLRNSVHA
jgi:PAS domain S-box-containing protein